MNYLNIIIKKVIKNLHKFVKYDKEVLYEI
jgi:hypothetical protein